MKWFVDAWMKFFDFSGRARRKEFWYFYFGNLVVFIALCFVEVLVGFATGLDEGILIRGYALAIVIPSVSAGIRRMHDTGRTGWWLLFPYLNVVFLLAPGTDGPNWYGPDPRPVELKHTK